MDIKLDNCFQFGLGAFETIAVEEGQAVFSGRHLRRLKKAAEFLNIGNPEERGITEEGIREYIKKTELVKGALKIMLSQDNVLMTTRDNPYMEENYIKGFQADFSPVKRNETSPLVYYKTMNYGDCILEKKAAAAIGFNERIFLNTKGQISEGTVSNIFFVHRNQICTPQVYCGLLPGIMREYLLENYDINEKVIYPEELKYYDECFVTNSLMGIMPVMQLGDKQFTERGTADRLRKEYIRNRF